MEVCVVPMKRDPIRVLLADDDAGFRSALCEWLELDARFVVVAESAAVEVVLAVPTAAEASRQVPQTRYAAGGHWATG